MAKRRHVDPLVQLAASVLARETTEIPWVLLRHTYFTARWERAAVRHLARWAEKYGISVNIRQGNARDERWIRFTVPIAYGK